MQNVAGVTGVTGSGYLAELRFKTIGNGAGNITISNGMLSDTLNQEILATWSGAAVNVAFTASGLTISPAEVFTGENVSIGVLASNTSTSQGTYQVTLKINNTVVETKSITLASGASQQVSFTVSESAHGTYSVDVWGLTGSFVVKAVPAVVTNNATNLTHNSARLNGDLTAKGSASTVNVSFQWGITSGNLTNETSPSEAKTGTGIFFFDLTGLNAATTYYFKAKAAGDGISYGAEKSFTTISLVAPIVTTSDASNVTINSAKLNGDLTALGSVTTVNVSFLWSTTSGSLTSETTPAEQKSATGTFSFNLTGLNPGITYYCKAKAVGDGTVYGDEKSFTTEPLAIVVSDNFNDNTIDTSLWIAYQNGFGPTVTETNQRLEITQPASSAEDPQ